MIYIILSEIYLSMIITIKIPLKSLLNAMNLHEDHFIPEYHLSFHVSKPAHPSLLQSCQPKRKHPLYHG